MSNSIMCYLQNLCYSCVCDDFGKLTEMLHRLGLFHFIDPANSYTDTLPIHSGITRLR